MAKQNSYLVYLSYGDLGPEPRIMDGWEIFGVMDMADCSDAHIDGIWLLDPPAAPQPCVFRGKWCCDAPLQMEIRTEAGEVLDVDYGTDH